MKTNWITEKYRIFLLISAAIMVVALVLSVCGAGMNFGIDFTGGSLLTYSVGEAFDAHDAELVLASAGYPDALVTKANPSQASLDLQAELAAKRAGEEAAVEEGEGASAEEGEDAANNAGEENAPEEAPAAMLNPDKSGIEDDGMTDLQIRLSLVDETEGMEDAVHQAVQSVYADAVKLSYRRMTNNYAKDNSLDGDYIGGYAFEYEIGQEGYDIAAIETAVRDALAATEIEVENISFSRYEYVEVPEETIAPEETAISEEITTPEETAEATEQPAEEVDPEAGTRMRILLTINDQTSHVRALLEKEMSAKYENFSFLSIDHVSATAGRDLIGNAVKALLIAFVCMLIYIALRFDPLSGVSALLALVHDVLIMCSFMVFFRAFFQVNSSFIAAVLTIVGYSINNTIIIFDRIRETAKKPGYTQLSRMEIVKISVQNTLSRTVNTTITTLITLVLLYIFGIDTIREFAFPLIVGMLAGVYSSVLLSGQTWAFLSEKYLARKAAKKANADA